MKDLFYHGKKGDGALMKYLLNKVGRNGKNMLPKSAMRQVLAARQVFEYHKKKPTIKSCNYLLDLLYYKNMDKYHDTLIDMFPKSVTVKQMYNSMRTRRVAVDNTLNVLKGIKAGDIVISEYRVEIIKDVSASEDKLGTHRIRSNSVGFRDMVEVGYGNKCLVTGSPTWQACHKIPYGEGEDTIENAIPLRADLHHMFDNKTMAIHPKTGKIYFADFGDNNYYRNKKYKIINMLPHTLDNLEKRWMDFLERDIDE